MGKGAEIFLNYLESAGQSWWQILPLGPTNIIFGNSPYMSFSAFGGNPLLISPDLLVEEGLLEHAELPVGKTSEYLTDYRQAALEKQTILALAYKRFHANHHYGNQLDHFTKQHPWLDDHALFLALKEKFKDLPWYEWPAEYRVRVPGTLSAASKLLADRINYYRFEQYIFFRQWNRLKKLANQKNIQIIGDLPIYVAADSVDVWANQDIFQLEPSTRKPSHIAGVPPDYFSATGQRWGNPLYRWHDPDPAVETQLLKWWEKRLRTIFSQVDAVRIDHFRGFESYWRIKADEETAINGSWVPGPGLPFFLEMEKRLGKLPIIAEDLGIITPEVEELRDALEFPGMKILLFAFDGNTDNPYLPYNHTQNCVVYTGTHDNDTVLGWYMSSEVNNATKERVRIYSNRRGSEATAISDDFIHLALSSPARLSILPMQDVLGFGNDCRMNTPSTTLNNWCWRCAPRFLSSENSADLHSRTAFFDRIAKPQTTEGNKNSTP